MRPNEYASIVVKRAQAKTPHADQHFSVSAVCKYNPNRMPQDLFAPLKETLVDIIALTALALLVALPIIALDYYSDSARCSGLAINYKATITDFSYWRGYCFVEMPGGTVVNLENYRAVDEIDQ